MQAIEGKKLAESWGATFVESSARENQVPNLKTSLVTQLTVSFLTHCLVVGMVREWCVCLRAPNQLTDF